ncbi:hypothetical protein CHUAL_014168 [Chamberlinius hualienensis]
MANFPGGTASTIFTPVLDQTSKIKIKKLARFLSICILHASITYDKTTANIDLPFTRRVLYFLPGFFIFQF